MIEGWLTSDAHSYLSGPWARLLEVDHFEHPGRPVLAEDTAFIGPPAAEA